MWWSGQGECLSPHYQQVEAPKCTVHLRLWVKQKLSSGICGEQQFGNFMHSCVLVCAILYTHAVLNIKLYQYYFYGIYVFCTLSYVLCVVDLSVWKHKLESSNIDAIDAVDSMDEESSDDPNNNSSAPTVQCSGNVLCLFVINVTVYV